MSWESMPYCTEQGEWEFEHQGMVIGPFETEADAWREYDRLDEESQSEEDAG